MQKNTCNQMGDDLPSNCETWDNILSEESDKIMHNGDNEALNDIVADKANKEKAIHLKTCKHPKCEEMLVRWQSHPFTRKNLEAAN